MRRAAVKGLRALSAYLWQNQRDGLFLPGFRPPGDFERQKVVADRVMRPAIPPPVTTSVAPWPALRSAPCSFARFICGRIIRK